MQNEDQSGARQGDHTQPVLELLPKISPGYGEPRANACRSVVISATVVFRKRLVQISRAELAGGAAALDPNPADDTEVPAWPAWVQAATATDNSTAATLWRTNGSPVRCERTPTSTPTSCTRVRDTVDARQCGKSAFT